MGSRLRVASGRQTMKHRVDRELLRLITEITNEINWQLGECKLTRADLAERVGVSPGRISQVLSGDENLTLRTLASLATALDARFEVQLRPCEPDADHDADYADTMQAAAYADADSDGADAAVTDRRGSLGTSQP